MESAYKTRAGFDSPILSTADGINVNRGSERAGRCVVSCSLALVCSTEQVVGRQAVWLVSMRRRTG